MFGRRRDGREAFSRFPPHLILDPGYPDIPQVDDDPGTRRVCATLAGGDHDCLEAGRPTRWLGPDSVFGSRLVPGDIWHWQGLDDCRRDPAAPAETGCFVSWQELPPSESARTTRAAARSARRCTRAAPSARWQRWHQCSPILSRPRQRVPRSWPRLGCRRGRQGTYPWGLRSWGGQPWGRRSSRSWRCRLWPLPPRAGLLCHSGKFRYWYVGTWWKGWSTWPMTFSWFWFCSVVSPWKVLRWIEKLF